MDIVAIRDRYQITIDRRRLMINMALIAFIFGGGLGIGVTFVITHDLRKIIEQSEANRSMLNAVKTQTADMERQANLLEYRCGIKKENL